MGSHSLTIFSNGEASIGYFKKEVDNLKRIHRRIAKIIRALEKMIQERLKELGLFSWEKGRLQIHTGLCKGH